VTFKLLIVLMVALALAAVVPPGLAIYLFVIVIIGLHIYNMEK